jgi:osmotically-inducible protein OsmY
MKKYKILAIACSFILQGCMSVAISGANAAYDHNNLQKKFSDAFISIRVAQRLQADPELSANNVNINVTVYHHLLLLTGQVPNELLRQHTVEVVQKIPGIIRIYNLTTVGYPLQTGAHAQDAWITTKIKAKMIGSNDIDPKSIKVITENRVVYLIGIVTKEEAEIAVEMATNTTGVEQVVKIFYYSTMPKIS